MNQHQLIEFANFLDEDNLLGKDYITTKTAEWLREHPVHSKTEATAFVELIWEIEQAQAAALNVAEHARIQKQKTEGADAMYTAYAIAARMAHKLFANIEKRPGAWMPNTKKPICYQTGDWDGKKSDLCLCENIESHCHPLVNLGHCYEYADGSFEWYDSRDFEILKPAKWRLIEADTPQVTKQEIVKILFETAQTTAQKNGNGVTMVRMFEAEAEAIIRLIYSK